MKMNRNWLILAGIAALVGTGCSKGDETAPTASTSGAPASVTGSVSIDGSTTVYPIVNFMADDFRNANAGANINVTKSGTGSGFKKFISGEIDICTASRTIEDKEDAECKAKGIQYIEIPIAYDGVTVIVNPANTAVNDLTADELKKAWGPDSTVTTWADIRAGLPAEKVTFYGPTDNHGTYEYFTEKICRKKNAIRKEYQPNQEYNAIVTSVAGDKNGMAYVGYSYYIENKDKVKAIKVGGVEANADTIAKGTYKPLSRTLFLYVNKKKYDENPSVKSFVDFALNAGLSGVTESDYIKLPDDAYAAVRDRVKAEKTGSIFMNAEAGKTTTDILNANK
jgi:phosphate transport system substrate-binding protein